MTEEEFEKGQYVANWAQLVEDNVFFIVPARKYDVTNDERLLIPFIKDHKIGFVNKFAIPTVEPEYDILYGSILKEGDLVQVGIRNTDGYVCTNGEFKLYDRYKWGISGDCLIQKVT